MLRLMLILLAVKYSVSVNWPKCCTGNSVITKVDSFYNCSESSNTTSRTQIVTNVSMSEEQEFCVDFDDSVSLFQSNGTNLTKVRNLDVIYFPKCCPLDYFYNATNHACVNSSKKLETFFNESFVKVGLPHCLIIQDFKLQSSSLKKNFIVVNGTLDLSILSKSYKDNFCVDKDVNNSFIVRECHDDYDICSSIKCVHKCCPDGQSFINGSHCRDTYINGLDFSTLKSNMDNTNDDFVIIHGYNRPIYALTPPGRWEFHLDKNGIFSMRELDNTLGNINVTREYQVDEFEYCLEHALKPTLKKYLFFRLFGTITVNTKFFYTRVAMAISCVFLMLTIIYYCCSKEKRTVFGKTLISYCSIALLGFLILAYLAFVRRPSSYYCTILMYVILYSTLSMVTWMNAMCIDIYCTFGSSKSFSSRQRKSQFRRFLLYSIYSWGLPVILIILPIALNNLEVLPTYAKLIVDPERCYIYKKNGNYGLVFFSTIPIAIFVLCNLVLFIKTAKYCLEVKKEISKMNDTNTMKGESSQKFDNFKDRFGLLVKLFVIMGISFLFEAVSTTYDFKKHDSTAVIEVIWDTINSLQGFFIFIIFVAKRRIFEKCKERLGLKRLRKFSLASSAVTQTTSLPNLGNK